MPSMNANSPLQRPDQRMAGHPLEGKGSRRPRPALLQPIAMAGVGAGLLALHKPVIGIVVLAAALLLLTLCACWPLASEATKLLSAAVAKGVAVALTWVLLVPFFFLCFVPGRAVLLLLREDPLNRRFAPDEPTYWTPRIADQDPSQMRRQY